MGFFAAVYGRCDFCMCVIGVNSACKYGKCVTFMCIWKVRIVLVCLVGVNSVCVFGRCELCMCVF